jgi:hypothetical protein
VRPELVLVPQSDDAGARSLSPVVVYGILAALGIGLFVAPFACKWPDGLGRVAENGDFADRESKNRAVAAPLDGYQVPGVSNGALATGLAGGVGTLAVLALGVVMARVIVPRKPLPETSNVR